MKLSRWIAVVLAVVCFASRSEAGCSGMSAASASKADKATKADWAFNATIIEACSCPMFCQCYFNAQPAGHHNHGGGAGEEHFCRFNNAYSVNKGTYNGVKLDGAKFWLAVLTDLRNRGVKDVFFVVCDGLKGLPEVVEQAWPAAIVHTEGRGEKKQREMTRR